MRVRLILAFVLIVLITTAGVVGIARWNAANEVHSFMFRGGMAGLSNLVEELEEYYRLNGSWVGVDAVLSFPPHGMMGGYGQGPGGQQQGPDMMQGMMNQRLRLADGQGNLVVDSAGLQPPGQRLSLQEMAAAIELKVNGELVGYLVAEGGMGFSSGDETLLVNRLTGAALTAGLMAGGVSLLLGLALAYSLVRPVRELTDAARRLGQGDLSQRVAARGDDELALLGRTFNQMADSLQKAEEGRRVMTADIAHELRNPLAVQRANLEALQDGVYALTGESLEPILEQNKLLTHLVEDLRTLALADAGQLTLERSQVDLPALVGRVVERFRPQADKCHTELILDGADAQMPLILLDAMRMEQILGNLLDNALRHTSAGGKVWIQTSWSGEEARVSVRDNGQGIPKEALPHIFERFYRADKSRSREGGGSGLGLAIARQLAEAHGGRLEAANHPAGGAVFTLSMPKW